MLWYSILSSVALYYVSIGDVLSYLMAKSELSDKSTEKILSMKNFRDVSTLKKALYVLVPGVYFAVKSEKADRVKLEEEVLKKYNIDPSLQLNQ